MKDRVLIIDGMNFIYRGVIKFGKPNNVDKSDYTIVYNFFRNLRALVENIKPTRCFFVLEGNPQFRKDLFPDYKKNRLVKIGSEKEKYKNNIFKQANIICDLLQFLPVTLAKASKFEADDTIYSLANNLKDEEVIIVSTDSDLIQILQSLYKHEVKLFHPGKKEYILAPKYIYLIWKSIAGDKKTDNIPGIKSAAVAEKIAKDPKELRNFLSSEENKANFLLNKKLIELQLVADKDIEFIQPNINFDKLFEEFKKLQFFSLIEPKYKEKFKQTFLNNCK